MELEGEDGCGGRDYGPSTTHSRMRGAAHTLGCGQHAACSMCSVIRLRCRVSSTVSLHTPPSPCLLTTRRVSHSGGGWLHGGAAGGVREDTERTTAKSAVVLTARAKAVSLSRCVSSYLRGLFTRPCALIIKIAEKTICDFEAQCRVNKPWSSPHRVGSCKERKIPSCASAAHG